MTWKDYVFVFKNKIFVVAGNKQLSKKLLKN